MTDPLDEQRAAIADAEHRLGPLQRRGRRQLAWLSVALGALLGCMHVTIVVFPPQRGIPAFLIACGVVIAAIMLLMIAYLRVRRVIPAGGTRRYLGGFAISMLLYLGALVLFIVTDETVKVAVVVALVVAAPLVITGLRGVRR